jgi:probable phosphoglycerate mutase
MTTLLLLRHAPTAWNEQGLLMGRADPPLSRAGRRLLATWRLPEPFGTAPLRTSPLRRARETAAAFGRARLEPRLIEMDWGLWEGRRLDDLRRDEAALLAELEARGLDLRPPGGESPREVCERLAPVFRDLAGSDRHVLVTHKGVLRAALALATGWDHRSKPPVRLRTGDALGLTLDERGEPTGEVAGVPLARGDAGSGP